MALYRGFHKEPIDTTPWYNAISLSGNPAVRGYLAEEVCLAAIRRNGLTAVNTNLKSPAVTEFFDGIPSWEQLINSPNDSHFYIPTTFNYPNIDAAILWLSRTKSRGKKQKGKKQKGKKPQDEEPQDEKPPAHLYLIQVTLAKTHKDSESKFYTTQWEEWTEVLRGKFTLSSTFVWVGKTTVKQNLGSEGIPEHVSCHVNIADVSGELHRLELGKEC
jgi:hypothetical protein